MHAAIASPARSLSRPHHRLYVPKHSLIKQHSRSLCCVVKADGHKGHAILHDFCMCIPYGALTLVTGLVSLALGAGHTGMIVTAGGVVSSASAVFSLKKWKAGGSSTLYTATSFAASVAVAWFAWQQFQQNVATIPNGITVGLSVAYALFALYNMIAGGNPPKQGTVEVAAKEDTA